jgi:hypothetical protein
VGEGWVGRACFKHEKRRYFKEQGQKIIAVREICGLVGVVVEFFGEVD